MESATSRSRTKILLVDDEPNILTSLSFLLTKEAYTIDTAPNGKVAVEKFISFRPDIILLDVMMPEMDGYSTASKIRELDENSNTQIIFLTAKGTANDKLTGYMKGADDYMVKPFDNVEILSKIKEKVK